MQRLLAGELAPDPRTRSDCVSSHQPYLNKVRRHTPTILGSSEEVEYVTSRTR